MTISIQSGPSWASLASDGRLIGTPTAIGSYPVVLASAVGVYSATTTVTIIVSQLAPVYFDVVSQLLSIGSVALSFQAYIGPQDPRMFPLTLTFKAVEVIVALIGALNLSFEAVTVAPPGSNDSFANARLINTTCSPSTQSIVTTGNNVGATTESGEPAWFGAGYTNKTVWFKFVAPSTVNYGINTTGSAISTLLAVYSGSSFSNLVQLATDSFIGEGSYTSTVYVNLTAGTTYYIQLAGAYNDEGNYVLTINYTCA